MVMMIPLQNPLYSSSMHHVLLLLLVGALLLRTSTCSGKSYPNPNCVASSCGDIRNLSYPFRFKGDPEGCGNPRFELVCEENRTVLYLQNGRYYVHSVYYEDDYQARISLVDDGLQKDNLSSLPRYTLTCFNFSLDYNYDCYSDWSTVTILNCTKPVTSPSYVTPSKPCIKVAYNSSSNGSRANNYYLCLVLDATAAYLEDFCTVQTIVLSSFHIAEEENRLNTYEAIHNLMADGFDLSISWYPVRRVFYCSFHLHVPGYGPWCGDNFYGYYDSIRIIVRNIFGDTAAGFGLLYAHFFAAKFIIGAPFVLSFLIYKWKRRNLAMDANVEEFLQGNNNFLPIRYSYYDIKKITKNFSHKLGEGGYGSVYQGKLRSGIEVAIKVLKESKGKSQDFISEVATIGRIHHVNVVQLIGYCIEGSKQALVYHFMPNGSLDKHIFSKVDGISLNCKKIYEIALGVARGIEYLHRGCDMQILHFDIKPHNILLDENFTPKVSDFGLARLYPTNRSIVSLTAARGTLGYMAPEFFYKDIGGISYKADVYSFGMLLMEMANRRRNFNANTEHSSRIYFPLWIYDQLDKSEPTVLEEIMDEEREITLKMIIIALWCIQLSPSHRPSMKRVINMLEGNVDKLQVPPKPHLYPIDDTPIVCDGEIEIELETLSSSLSAPFMATTT